MKKFEYHTLKFGSSAEELKEVLNKIGQEGWELVQVVETSGYYIMFFKREII